MEDFVVLAEVTNNMSGLLCKAAVDEDFRSLCLKDCSKAYEAYSGKELPGQYRVRFIEEGQEPAAQELPLCVLPQYLPPTWLG